jgi:hypothetical protein
MAANGTQTAKRGRGKKSAQPPPGAGDLPMDGGGAKWGGNVSKELFHVHAAALAKDERKRDEIQGRIRNRRKQMKADGINLQVFDAVRKLAKLDPADIIDALNTQTLYGQFDGVVPFTQLSFIDALDMSDEAIAQRARGAGLIAGREGRDMSDNPNAPDSEAGQAWIQGWHEGQGDLGAKLSGTA